MRTMKFHIIALLVLASCSEPPSDPTVVPDPYAEFYAIVTVPDWPVASIDGEWQSVGGRFTIKGDTLTDNGKPYAMEARTKGAELWLTTTGRRHTFRGICSDKITGKIIIEGANGRPGPIESITFQRVQ